MIYSFLRTPLVFQAVRSIGTCNLHHLSSFCRQVPSVPPCELGASFRHTSPFLSFPRRNAWTSAPIMATPAGDDFQGREWKKGEAHEVLPKVFLGSMEAAKDKESIQEHGITHVLTVNGKEPPFEGDFKYKVINFGGQNGDLTPHLEESMGFVEEGKAAGGVLIHCTHGTGRSAAMTIAAVMKSNGEGTPGGVGRFDEAFRTVKARRPGTDPPLPFQQELGAWEEKSHAP